MVNAKKEEYGDWQTNLPLAISICEQIKAQGIRPQVIIEPTCGRGNFIIAALLTFDSIEDVYGIEIYKPYLDILEEELKNFKRPLDNVNMHLFHENIFNFDFREITENIKGRVVLAIGNPPWVTNSKLSEMGSKNLPVKTNFKKVKGLEAITGKANFDIAEYICIQLIEKLSAENAYFSFLLKSSVIKNLIYEQKAGKALLSEISQYNIDAQKEFNVSVSAALLSMRLFGGRERSCHVYDFYTKSSLCHFGWVNGKFVADVDKYVKTSTIDGISPFIWRSGLKHDCSKVMELSKEANGIYVNAMGEIVDIEDDVIYPLIKSADIKGEILTHTRRYVIVTQHSKSEDTRLMKERYPKAYQYLVNHSAYLDNRKSSIYKDRPRFCMFGIGDYTFMKYKIVISSLYKQTRFSLATDIEGKTPVCDDTCYMLGFDNYNIALFILGILNSVYVQNFIKSVCFYDAKRVINKDLLMRINLMPAIKFLSNSTFGLTKDEYDEAEMYVIRHSKAITAQQSIDFGAFFVAEPFECYKWEGFDQSICDFFGGDNTILVGCYKDKKYQEWILSHNLYNIRLGMGKGSMEANKELFESTSLLVLYELGKPNKLSAYKITGHQEMGKEELLKLDYPNKRPRKSYMTFSITPLDMDLTFLADHHLIERLIELNAENAKGTPVFIEP